MNDGEPPAEGSEPRPMTHRLEDWLDEHRQPLYRLPHGVRRPLLWMADGASMRRTEQWHETRDVQENDQTRPPADEHFELGAVWLVELFTPTTIKNLAAAVRSQAWIRAMGVNDDLSDWIETVRLRRYGSSYTRLSTIYGPDANPHQFLGAQRISSLPGEFEYAEFTLLSVTPSTTALVGAFVPTTATASKLDAAIRDDAKTTTQRLAKGRGHSIYNVEANKVRSVLRMREQVRRAARDWMFPIVPGDFAAGLLDGDMPTLELILTRAASPLDLDPSSRATPPTLRILGLEMDFRAWRCTDGPKLYLTNERRLGYGNELPVSTLTLSGRLSDVFTDEELAHHGSDRRSATLYRLHADYLPFLASRWALDCQLTGFERRLSRLRDLTQTDLATRPQGLDTLRRDLLRSGVDHQVVLADLVTLAENRFEYEYGSIDFESCDDVLPTDGEPPAHLLQGMRNAQSQRAVANTTLDSQLRTVLSQVADLSMAATNIRLQRRVLWLTIISTLAAVAAAVAAFVALRATTDDPSNPPRSDGSSLVPQHLVVQHAPVPMRHGAATFSKGPST